MSTRAAAIRPAWDDRWSEPKLADLLEAIPEQHQISLGRLIEALDELEELNRRISWHGEAWKWTVEYTIDRPGEKDAEPVCYLVPNTSTPLVCVPLEAPVIDRLPVRRLARSIRDGIRSAKCAVTIHWATWNPSSKAEAEALTDLIKRKLKIFNELKNGNGSSKSSSKRKVKSNGKAEK